MNAPQPCRLEMLAQSESCVIEYCRACEVFHVHLGKMTLHLQPTEFRSTSASMNLAWQKFNHQKNSDATTARSSVRTVKSMH